MSWLARSIANTLHLDDDEVRQNDAVHSREADSEEDRFDDIELNNQNHSDSEHDGSNGNNNDNQGRGVKEDLSEFTETLTRQLWGVASFLAPPPPPPPLPPTTTATRQLELEREANEESDGSGSENGSEEEEYVKYVEGSGNYRDDAVGLTEEALAFAQNIAHHPETWLDFPFSEDEEFEDFEISDAQHKHALAIERLAPRLAALRIELCPAHMSEGYFWMVYFVLLHSRLNKHDADLLSSPQLVQARSMWMQELQMQTKPKTDWFGRKTFYSQVSTNSPREDFDLDPSEDYHPRYMSHTTYAAEHRPYNETTDFETEKHPIECNEVQFMNKSVEDPSGESEKELLSGPSRNLLLLDNDDDDDGDDWLEETAELEGFSVSGVIVGNEEDVSFSDLEEDSDWTIPIKSK